MRRALVLANPKARKAASLRAELEAELAKQGITVVRFAEEDPAGFCELIHRSRNEVDRVIVAGGDGTCRCVVATLRDSSLPLGIIPMGTANNLARSLGIPAGIEAAVRIIADGNTRRIDVADVNGELFLNVSGMGLSTQVNRTVPGKSKRRWGVLAYIAHLFKIARRMRPFVAEITCDGKTTRVRSLQITVGNGRYYGSGLPIAEDATIDDKRLDLVSINVHGWWQALRLLPGLLSGRHRRELGARLLSGREIEVKTTPRLSLDTDGEITTHTPARYGLDAGALTVFAPLAH